MTIGHIIGGRVAEHLLIRLKNDSNVNVGDLLICQDKGLTFYLKVIDKLISSSIPSQFIEEMSGQELELDKEIELFDESERFYPLAYAKILRVKSIDFSDKPLKSLTLGIVVLTSLFKKSYIFLRLRVIFSPTTIFSLILKPETAFLESVFNGF